MHKFDLQVMRAQCCVQRLNHIVLALVALGVIAPCYLKMATPYYLVCFTLRYGFCEINYSFAAVSWFSTDLGSL